MIPQIYDLFDVRFVRIDFENKVFFSFENFNKIAQLNSGGINKINSIAVVLNMRQYAFKFLFVLDLLLC